MKIRKLSLAVVMLYSATPFLYAQKSEQDTVKKEKNIEGIILKSSSNKKSESALLVDQKKAIIQKQSMGSEEISRKGISNVEQGLKKVTGITTVEGRGLFVRGLEERYNTLLINGLGSPSNNPFQKIIALKQFPTDVVGKLNIYKTFSTNLYADFAGATFDIETLTIDRPFSKVEFGIGYNTQTTFKNFKVNPDAYTMKGYIGQNSKGRQLPDEVKGYVPMNYEFSKQQSLNSFEDGWNVDKIKALPNTNIGFTTAQKFKVGEAGNLGLLLSLNQGTKYEMTDGNKNQFLSLQTVGEMNNDLNRKEYTYELESSALLGLGYKNKGLNVGFNTIYLQNSTNSISDFTGYKNQDIRNAGKGFFRVDQMDISKFLDVQLWASQKIGDRHLFKVGGSWVKNNFQQPDRKISEGILTDNPNEVKMNFGGNNLIRQYLDVDGNNYFSTLAEYAVLLGEKGDRKSYPWQVTVGYNGFVDHRSNSYRFINASINTDIAKTVVVDIDRPQQSFEDYIQKGYFHFKENTNETVYRSNLYQFVNAGYTSVNFKPNDTWDILVGGRVENSINITRYKKQGDSDFRDLIRNQYFLLPSLSIKKELNSKSNIRFAASKTLTRPILIEYMPITYINPDNENILGNKDLKNSENYNIDLKYEIFPTNKEMFAINLFVKKIEKAIERGYVASGNSTGTAITFFNAKNAVLGGVELEGTMNLSRISESLNQWTIGSNATFMYSKVERSENQLEQERLNNFTGELKDRKLQGAAPWTVNADLKYEFKNGQNLPQTASLVYNVSGSKIFTVGTSGLDHIYERPFHQLDFVYNTQLTKNWNIKMGILNLLNSTYQLDQGDDGYIPLNVRTNIHTDYKRGTSVNFTAGYTF
ncbi:TonB-dependent receptor [Chryseobacterium sp. SNU WT5]|uniref:TonB-dependent receptor plug domain-containing protein n=1 Tax=Chryseobacterium sp. SNU WT5 TaxID=2594269 RepID=UPI001181632F|nr:TonB-dependent receptor plug domain-containing protein [Chryseobacterium sp. SNU WT5]QDP84532.1 TonB-dependent receptor [Chryseobacterium sp. SNU WT5]